MRKYYFVWGFLLFALTALFTTEGCRLQNATSPAMAASTVPTATPVRIVDSPTPTFTATPIVPTPTPTPVVVNTVDATNFTTEVLDCKTPVMVVCGASWCYWCGLFDPIAQSFATDYAGKMMVVKVDCSSGVPSFLSTYTISGYPTSLFFVGGKLKTTVDGYVPESSLISAYTSL
jgi:thioredoxin-like negative regulator of GroEL